MNKHSIKNQLIQNVMKTFRNIALIAISALLINCSDSNSTNNQEVTCDTSNSEFRQIFNQLIQTNVDEIYMDTEIHGYQFKVLTAKNICSIGYQSIPAMASTPYRIEIHNNTTNSVIYSGDHIFSSSATSYVSVGSIPLVAGNTYTIKRIQTNWGNNIANTIGRTATSSSGDFSFPLSMGDLQITQAEFDDNQLNSVLPYIDIVFEQ